MGAGLIIIALLVEAGPDSGTTEAAGAAAGAAEDTKLENDTARFADVNAARGSPPEKPLEMLPNPELEAGSHAGKGSAPHAHGASPSLPQIEGAALLASEL